MIMHQQFKCLPFFTPQRDDFCADEWILMAFMSKQVGVFAKFTAFLRVLLNVAVVNRAESVCTGPKQPYLP